MDTRRLIVALFAAMGVYIAYISLYSWLVPRKPPPATIQESVLPDFQPPALAPNSAPAQTSPAVQAPASARSELAFTEATDRQMVKLGGAPADALEIELDPQGASLAYLKLTQRAKATPNSRLLYRETPKGNEPLTLLHPETAGEEPLNSFATRNFWIVEQGQEPWSLSDLVWQREPSERPDREARFSTTLRDAASGQPVARVEKSYRLADGSPLIVLGLRVENLGALPIRAILEQDGPVGIPRADMQRADRRLLSVRKTPDGPVSQSVQRVELQRKGARLLATPPDSESFLWTALTNKYFAVFTRPLPTSGDTAGFIRSVQAELAAPQQTADIGDLVARLITVPLELAAGASRELQFEIYAGPKDLDVLAQVNPAFADRGKLAYALAHDADVTCSCTFRPLPEIMTWLLQTVRGIVGNYGIAIIVLVIIIRTLLHPLTVFQQKSMYRMQEAMGRVQPKMEAIKQKFANDKVKMNQELMKLWAEENVNPAAGLISMVPLFVQMPILIALWTALNTDIHLRHAMFDGWWISDLSAPDALIQFSPSLTIPVLSWLPLVGSMFKDIPSFNLLPVLMGVSMWLQQKYMPKPAHLEERLKAAREQTHERPAGGGMTPEEQVRQQQMIAYTMSLLFPLMFYYMPAGLNLYWMATNVFGIGESLIIRKQLREERERRNREGPKPPPAKKKPGFFSKLFEGMARQAEDLQRKADEISEREGGRKRK